MYKLQSSGSIIEIENFFENRRRSYFKIIKILFSNTYFLQFSTLELLET